MEEPGPDPKFVDLLTTANDFLTDRQDELKRQFHLGEYDRFEWDWDDGSLVFTSAGIARVKARFQYVGSVSRSTGTWLWGWANPNIAAPLTKDINEVRRFGEQAGIWQLTTRKWEADQTDGWEMTIIASYVLQSRGAYCAPSDEVYSFLVFTEVEWTPAPAA